MDTKDSENFNETRSEYDFFSKISTPDDLKNMTGDELKMLCRELRDYTLEVISQKGGHLGASLGVTEITVALHYIFNTPHDKIVWDVGHQAYIHKLLTGRKKAFNTIRKKGGLSGFPNIFESDYDAFGVGHSSTSISAALGMSVANALKNNTPSSKTIAVIGDGAITGGIAFEAINHAGDLKKDLLVVLNDNCMSIDPNVGALKNYLVRIASSKSFNKVRDEIWDIFSRMRKIGMIAKNISHKAETTLKSLLSEQSNFFESLGFKYFGPIDGHNVKELVKVLEDLKVRTGPILLHIITKKGKGYPQAETGNETHWHAPGLFDVKTGESTEKKKAEKQPLKFQDVFGNTIVELAEKNEKIVAITPAMPTGSSLKKMMEVFPERVFDVGICEQHAVTFSAGLATQGLKPFCAIYSTFLQRGYDQLIHDVAIQNLPVVFCIDRAGLVGEDGATHQGVFDLSYMRCIPNIVISAPMDEHELRNLMFTAQLEHNNFPFAIRYPRGKGEIFFWKNDFSEIEIGKGKILREGKNILILSIGTVGTFVDALLEELAEKSITIGHYDMRFVKPLDKNLLKKAMEYSSIITIEDGSLIGGFGSAVLETMSEMNYSGKIKRLGVQDVFIEHSSQSEQHQECGIDKETLRTAIETELTSLKK